MYQVSLFHMYLYIYKYDFIALNLYAVYASSLILCNIYEIVTITFKSKI